MQMWSVFVSHPKKGVEDWCGKDFHTHWNWFSSVLLSAFLLFVILFQNFCHTTTNLALTKPQLRRLVWLCQESWHWEIHLLCRGLLRSTWAHQNFLQVFGIYLITFIKSFTTIFAPICGVIIMDPGCGGYGFQFWRNCNDSKSAFERQVLDEVIRIQDQCPGFWAVYDKWNVKFFF